MELVLYWPAIPGNGASATLLLKTDFPIPSRYQFQISSWLGVRFYIHVPSQHWKSVYIESL